MIGINMESLEVFYMCNSLAFWTLPLWLIDMDVDIGNRNKKQIPIV